MNLLLDTQVFLWAIHAPKRLSPSARQKIQAADEVFVSAASIWEAAMKAGLGKLEVDVPSLIDAIHEAGFVELPVRGCHAALVTALPRIHHDPFDRLLVAQALHEPLRLLTSDAILTKYPVLVEMA